MASSDFGAHVTFTKMSTTVRKNAEHVHSRDEVEGHHTQRQNSDTNLCAFARHFECLFWSIHIIILNCCTSDESVYKNNCIYYIYTVAVHSVRIGELHHFII